jgi:hypothetical protein
MSGAGGKLPLTIEEAHRLLEHLRFLLHQRDQLSLEAASIAGELDRAGYGESMRCLNTAELIRFECKLGYQAAADASGLMRSTCWRRRRR